MKKVTGLDLADEVPRDAIPVPVVANDIDTDTQLVEVVKETGVNNETALSLQQSFTPLFKNARNVLTKSLGIVVTDASQKLEMKLARECRLELKAIRVESDKIRKGLKEESLRRGKAIDGFHNILVDLIGTEEKRLEDQEKFVEKQEAARKEALKQTREAELKQYEVDTTFMMLGEMSDDSYKNLLVGAKAAYEAKVAALKKEEEDRVAKEKADAEERERVKAENERLKKEAAKKDAELKAANKKAKLDAKVKEELESIIEDDKKLLAKERASLEKKKEEEAAKQAKIDEEKRRAEAAPDKEKFINLAIALRSMKNAFVPGIKSKQGKAIVEQMGPLMDKLATWIETKAKDL